MSQPESDQDFRARVLRAVSEDDRSSALIAVGAALDRIGRRYDRFRYGVPLCGEPEPREAAVQAEINISLDARYAGAVIRHADASNAAFRASLKRMHSGSVA